MNTFLNRERVIALVCMAFSGWMYVEAGKFPTSVLDSVGSSLYPRFLAGVIAVAALILFVTSRGASKPVKGQREFASFGLMAGAAACYLLAMPRIGFIPATIPFLLALTLYFDRRDWKTRPKAAVPYSILFTLVMYFFFANVLGVLLPGIGPQG